jgi:hypothetical protein
MILRDVPLNWENYMYLERYVNCGSPSGFTDEHTTSPGTRPKDFDSNFYLCAPEFPESVVIKDFGKQPAFFQNWQMLVHPDMIKNGLFSTCPRINHEAVLVTPTACARTVKMVGENGWFLKLHYKGLIGRVERQIGMNQAQSSVEVSNAISAAIQRKTLPRFFYFMREPFARVAKLPNGGSTTDWGIVLREPNVFPYDAECAFVVPAFSLFSPDLRRPDDPTILIQLISNQPKAVEDFLFEDLLTPLFDVYFTLLLQCGLQLEAHSQNTLFVIDRNLQIKGVVARDAESVDKDMSLIEELDLPDSFQRMPYKCLFRGQYNYHIMHSFMFDFKLGEYLVSPLIAEAARHYDLDPDRLTERIRFYNRNYLAQLPQDFFPVDGQWYSYANIVHDRNRERPYIAHPNPRYR